MIEILVLQALAHEAQGDSPAALVPLERALTLAEPEGYVRSLWTKGCRWLVYSMKPSLKESNQIIFVGCWQYSLLRNLSKRHHRQLRVPNPNWSSR